MSVKLQGVDVRFARPMNMFLSAFGDRWAIRGSASRSAIRGSVDSLVERVARFDLVTVVLVVHGTVLLAGGQVLNRAWVTVGVVALGGWRLGLGLYESRSSIPAPVQFAKEVGSLLLAAILLAADGGTESPFFFWPVILLASQALIHSVSHFEALVAVALAAYVTVLIAVPDVTASSVGRLGLLGAFCVVLAVGRERVERHRAEASRMGQLLQEAFGAAPIALAVTFDDPPRVVFANHMAEAIGIADLPNKEETLPGLSELIARVAEHGQPVGPELLVLSNPHGPSQYLRMLATPHRFNGETGVVLCGEDVTSKVMIGEERRRFLELASHQLRTPLTPILGYALLLRDGQVAGSEAEEAIALILESARRLERLFERMAVVVRLQHDSTAELTQVNVGGLLTELRRLDPEILDGVEFSGDDGVTVHCHPRSVALALAELVDNGRRFGEPPVSITWQRDREEVALRVSDRGPGPKAGSEAAAFSGVWGWEDEHDVMPQGMGTRLGLLYANLLITLTGGHFELERTSGHWAFVLRLPTANSHQSTDTKLSPRN